LRAVGGFVPAGDAGTGRANPRRQRRPAPARPGNAFAALANLKR
jgi:hypothetical protein